MIKLGVKQGEMCDYSKAFMLDNWIRRKLIRPRKIASRFVKKGDIVIDIGCGPGFFIPALCEEVGPTGKVIAVDAEPRMLKDVKTKVDSLGIQDRVILHESPVDTLSLKTQADFILAYNVAHETPNMKNFIEELNSLMHKDSTCLIVEPKFHVSKSMFNNMLQEIEDSQFIIMDHPAGCGGMSVLFNKATDKANCMAS